MAQCCNGVRLLEFLGGNECVVHLAFALLMCLLHTDERQVKWAISRNRGGPVGGSEGQSLSLQG